MELLAGKVLLFPYHRDFPHQAVLKASSQVVVYLGMAGKASKGTWVTRGAGDTPLPQHSSILSHTGDTSCLWHQRKPLFLEHSFGGAEAACHLPLGHVSLPSWPERLRKKGCSEHS